ncbi:MAG: universal stress protein [Desulfobaccales bacterium]|jgi:nucleotide-binding universal stress UspA family protein
MFKKLLVPLDGSDIAAKILPKVVELARCSQAKVTLFHVCQRGILPSKAAEAREEKFCSTFLAEAGKGLQEQGLDADWTCVDGAPAREIMAFAQDKGCDLIVLGTHGAGAVAWYLGGVAEKVVSRSGVPVLLVRTLEIKVPPLKEDYSPAPGIDLPDPRA